MLVRVCQIGFIKFCVRESERKTTVGERDKLRREEEKETLEEKTMFCRSL